MTLADGVRPAFLDWNRNRNNKKRVAGTVCAVIVFTILGMIMCGSGANAQTDWRTFGFDRQRSGYNPSETALSVSTVPGLQKKWQLNLGDPITAQPVEMNGILYAATWGGAIYAINPGSGAILWHRQLGTTAANPSCQDFFPSGNTVGIIGTPATDLGNGRIFVISGDGLLHALDPVTGAEWSGYPVQVIDAANQPPHSIAYSALQYTYENASVYVATAGECDIPPYHGQLIQVDVLWSDTPHVVHRWYTNGSSGPGGGAVWGAAGIALDPSWPSTSSLYAATGNALANPENPPWSDSIVRLDGNLNFQAGNSPPDLDNQTDDNDFGATPVPYGTACLAVPNKNGNLYVYNRNAIPSGPVAEYYIDGSGFGETDGAVAVNPALNMLYVMSGQDSTAFSHGLIAFNVNGDCSLRLAWQQPIGVNGVPSYYYGNVTFAPVTANGVVYASDGYDSTLWAFNARTGQYLWDDWTACGCISTPIYSSPTVVNGMVFVGDLYGSLTAFGL